MRKENKLNTYKNEATHKEPKADDEKNVELGKISKQVCDVIIINIQSLIVYEQNKISL